ncbi:MAG TPA: hypothetical protein VLL05_02875, partial [Terriglobales bacterium]|nr:hypothetical protein [Terriglobales bacterium]
MASMISFCACEKQTEKRTGTRTLVLTITVLAILAAVSGTTPLMAQSPSFPDFSSTTNLVFNGTA